NVVRLTVKARESTPLALKIRWPGWCARPEVKVNRRAVSLNSQPCSYITLDRRWKDGDTIELRLPMTLRTEPLPFSGGKIVAAVYGPPVLAGIVPSTPGLPDPAKERYSDHLKARHPNTD